MTVKIICNDNLDEMYIAKEILEQMGYETILPYKTMIEKQNIKKLEVLIFNLGQSTDFVNNPEFLAMCDDNRIDKNYYIYESIPNKTLEELYKKFNVILKTIKGNLNEIKEEPKIKKMKREKIYE